MYWAWLSGLGTVTAGLVNIRGNKRPNIDVYTTQVHITDLAAVQLKADGQWFNHRQTNISFTAAAALNA